MSGHGCKESNENSYGGTVYRTYHRFSDERSLSTSVILALESAPGVDLTGAGRPLFDIVDPDALDALFTPTGNTERADGTVTFSVDDHTVRVSATGEIVVERAGVLP